VQAPRRAKRDVARNRRGVQFTESAISPNARGVPSLEENQLQTRECTRGRSAPTRGRATTWGVNARRESFTDLGDQYRIPRMRLRRLFPKQETHQSRGWGHVHFCELFNRKKRSSSAREDMPSPSSALERIRHADGPKAAAQGRSSSEGSPRKR